MVDGAKYIRLWGESIRVGAKIHTIGGLSAHADQKALTRWYSHIKNRPQLILVHGETEALQGLADKIDQDYQVKATIAEPGQEFSLC